MSLVIEFCTFVEASTKQGMQSVDNVYELIEPVRGKRGGLRTLDSL